MEKAKRKAGNIVTVFSVLILIWMLLSFMEVNAKNLTENPAYNDYNFFVLITE